MHSFFSRRIHTAALVVFGILISSESSMAEFYTEDSYWGRVFTFNSQYPQCKKTALLTQSGLKSARACVVPNCDREAVESRWKIYSQEEPGCNVSDRTYFSRSPPAQAGNKAPSRDQKSDSGRGNNAGSKIKQTEKSFAEIQKSVDVNTEINPWIGAGQAALDEIKSTPTPPTISGTCLELDSKSNSLCDFWINKCSTYITVKWSSDNHCNGYKCMDLVAPGGKSTISKNRGLVYWKECVGRNCSIK